MQNRLDRYEHSDKSGPFFTGFEPDLCFIPTWAKRNKQGYQTIWGKELGDRPLSHRHVVSLFIGPIPAFAMVLHRCGNRDCINPLHLYVGDAQTNKRDKELHALARKTNSADKPYRPSDSSGRVLKPAPVVGLSKEASIMDRQFQNVSADRCFHATWLDRTVDGQYVRLVPTRLPGEFVGMHRRVYELFIAPITKYDRIGHTCGDGTCLNPFHLVSAGKFDQEAVELSCDGRRTVSRAARADAANLDLPIKDVARKHGIHWMTVQIMRTEFKRGVCS